jgi:MFS family permease
VAAVFTAGTGVGSILPILPLFLRDRGASFALTGVVVSASLFAQAVGQWPAGWLADRMGRATMMVSGLLLAAGASLAFVLPLSVPWLIGLRFLQGLGVAAAMPAERAAVADLVPPAELGVAYGWLSAARIAGLVAGPALGGGLAVFGRWTVFVLTAVTLALAALVAGVALNAAARSGRLEVPAPLSLRALRPGPAAALRGILILTAGVSLMIGSYDVVWSLFMRSIGASDFLIGLSFSLWALPFVIVTPLAGWLSDRLDRRWLVVGGIVLTGLLAPLYPTFPFIAVAFGVGVIEAAAFAFVEPARNAFLMDAMPAEVRGQSQGTVGMIEGGSMAIGAIAGGALFAGGRALPFVAGAVACVGFALLAIPALLRAGAKASEQVRFSV